MPSGTIPCDIGSAAREEPQGMSLRIDYTAGQVSENRGASGRIRARLRSRWTVLLLAGMALASQPVQAQMGARGGFQGKGPRSGEGAQRAERQMVQASGLVPAFPAAVKCPAIASAFGSPTRYDGSRRPPWEFGGLHGGIDITLAEDTPLLAIAAGRVVHAGEGGMMEGIFLWLQHAPADTGLPFWVYAKYQHLREIPRIGTGEAVRAGQVIALSGKTGTAGPHYGPAGYAHLHLTTFAGRSERFEVRASRVVAEDGRIFDPLGLFVPGLDSPEAIGRLSDDRRAVPVAYVAGDGAIQPPGSRLVWPVGCERP